MQIILEAAQAWGKSCRIKPLSRLLRWPSHVQAIPQGHTSNFVQSRAEWVPVPKLGLPISLASVHVVWQPAKQQCAKNNSNRTPANMLGHTRSCSADGAMHMSTARLESDSLASISRGPPRQLQLRGCTSHRERQGSSLYRIHKR